MSQEEMESTVTRRDDIAGDARAPKVSIGLPVHNGERYLRESLDSILSQTFKDFEVVISDNASEDATEAICREYVNRDKRVRYSRTTHNVGAAHNHNLVFEMSRGQYFMWAAYDDKYDKNLLLKEVTTLDANPGTVLCYPIFLKINEHGNIVGQVRTARGTSAYPHQRLRSLFRLEHTCEQMYGLMRADMLRKTRLHRSYTDSDRTLLAEISLHGRYSEVAEPLFYHRVHPRSSNRVFADWRERMLWFNPQLKGKVVFPHWIQCMDYLATISRSPLKTTDRIKCYATMFEWFLRYGKALVKDLLVASASLVNRKPGVKARRDAPILDH